MPRLKKKGAVVPTDLEGPTLRWELETTEEGPILRRGTEIQKVRGDLSVAQALALRDRMNQGEF